MAQYDLNFEMFGLWKLFGCPYLGIVQLFKADVAVSLSLSLLFMQCDFKSVFALQKVQRDRSMHAFYTAVCLFLFGFSCIPDQHLLEPQIPVFPHIYFAIVNNVSIGYHVRLFSHTSNSLWGWFGCSFCSFLVSKQPNTAGSAQSDCKLAELEHCTWLCSLLGSIADTAVRALKSHGRENRSDCATRVIKSRLDESFMGCV